MSTPKEMLTYWLKDAYAMEQQAVTILTRQKQRLSNYPILESKIDSHIEQSKEHAEAVKGCLERLGSNTSKVKESAGRLLGNIAALANAAAGDEVVKNSIADFAFENFEIACYTSLIGAAEALGEEEIKSTCEDILEEEKEMASWIEEHLAQVTAQYLEREGAEDITAKS